MELVEHVTGGDPGAIIQKFAGRSDEDEPPVDPAQARADWLGERIIDDAHWRLERTYDCPVHVAAAVRELDRFSRSPHWWARLYTAEMLRRHESFRRKDIVERLRKDENKMVAEWVDRPYYHGMMPEEFQEWKKSMPGMPDRPK
ncbi:MAG TPA: hypothetical protein PLD59_11095 [Tepidisphaeraceae bacterium]|nr:hypothetical protein [Tepidisphaeraceae bacterium]